MSINAYTDGSSIPDEGSAAGVGVVFVDTTSQTILASFGQFLGCESPAYAELYAIKLALQEIRIFLEEIRIPVSAIRICSDCQSALDLCIGDSQTQIPEQEVLILEIEELLEELPPVDFQWVRSHSNHPYNDFADYIAYTHAKG